jgi:6-phosphogluconate dehydrogenase
MEQGKKYDIGMVGLGVMGRNLLLNMADGGFSIIGLDTDSLKVNALHTEAQAGKSVYGTTAAEEFISSLQRPRAIMLLVPAGSAVDAVINSLLPLLERGDILIDGGNSFFEDTNQREKTLTQQGIYFLGVGISGGAKGARFGPSIMPGGDKKAYGRVQPIFESIAAKVNSEPCVSYLGSSSAGHYVKMVHNGIEYGLMQLIAETYDVLKRGLGIGDEGLAGIYEEWNAGELKSFLIEITASIFKQKDDISGQLLVNSISDRAAQKGTGKWTSQNAYDLHVPLPTIDAAVTMRDLSAKKEQREKLAQVLASNPSDPNPYRPAAINSTHVQGALYVSMLTTFAQGMAMLSAASKTYGYDLQLSDIARIWRGGCIIRADCLDDIYRAYKEQPDLPSLLLDPHIGHELLKYQSSLRHTIKHAIDHSIPVPALMASLSYVDAYRTDRLPTSLIQAQRDYFGSHTYERTDREGVFHTLWE